MLKATAHVAAVVALVAAAGCAHRVPPRRPIVQDAGLLRLVATAYCQTGRTASGVRVRPGMVAADPALLPFGTVLRVVEADGVSGTYTVTDTGAAIRGRAVDIFMSDCRRATAFGRKTIVVRVIRRGSG